MKKREDLLASGQEEEENQFMVDLINNSAQQSPVRSRRSTPAHSPPNTPSVLSPRRHRPPAIHGEALMRTPDGDWHRRHLLLQSVSNSFKNYCIRKPVTSADVYYCSGHYH